MLEAGAVAAAENIQGYRQLVTPHARVRSSRVGIDIDQLHPPVAGRATGGRIHVDDWRAADMQRLRQRLADIGKDVWTSIHKALIVEQPARPCLMVGKMHWPWLVRHRLGRGGNVLIQLGGWRLRGPE